MAQNPTREENMRKMVQHVKQNYAKLRECPFHLFEKRRTKPKEQPKFVCKHCGGVVDSCSFVWYKRGIEHMGELIAKMSLDAVGYVKRVFIARGNNDTGGWEDEKEYNKFFSDTQKAWEKLSEEDQSLVEKVLAALNAEDKHGLR